MYELLTPPGPNRLAILCSIRSPVQSRNTNTIDVSLETLRSFNGKKGLPNNHGSLPVGYLHSSTSPHLILDDLVRFPLFAFACNFLLPLA
jgi:hypothetical protein